MKTLSLIIQPVYGEPVVYDDVLSVVPHIAKEFYSASYRRKHGILAYETITVISRQNSANECIIGPCIIKTAD